MKPRRERIEKTSVDLTPGQIETLQKIAAKYGYLQSRGPGTGKIGSVSQLLQAVARGDAEIVLKLQKK